MKALLGASKHHVINIPLLPLLASTLLKHLPAVMSMCRVKILQHYLFKHTLLISPECLIKHLWRTSEEIHCFCLLDVSVPQNLPLKLGIWSILLASKPEEGLWYSHTMNPNVCNLSSVSSINDGYCHLKKQPKALWCSKKTNQAWARDGCSDLKSQHVQGWDRKTALSMRPTWGHRDFVSKTNKQKHQMGLVIWFS